jgi:two-component system, LytTR family, sensor histidine kinase AlgZ
MTDETISRSPWSSISKVLLINLAIGVLIVALNVTIGRWAGWAWFRELVLANLLYANVMGAIAATVIPPVAIRTAVWPPIRRWTAYLAVLIAVGLTGPMAAAAALVLFGFAPRAAWWQVYQNSVGLALLMVIVIGLLAYALERLRYQAEASTRALRAQELERERIEKLAAEARLSSLESRLQPHFLFNTINSILALMREDPRGAEAMLERLARLLRCALDQPRRGLVPLDEELRLVEDYLEIERARFGERLHFQLDIAPGCAAAAVPAYAIQTLVENAMKYAIAPRREGGRITVRARHAGNTLRLDVEDDGPGFTREDLRDGHGLDTLEQRLATLCGPAARLDIVNANGNGARVSLQLPAKELPA